MKQSSADLLAAQLGRALAHLELLLEAVEAKDQEMIDARAAAARRVVNELVEQNETSPPAM